MLLMKFGNPLFDLACFNFSCRDHTRGVFRMRTSKVEMMRSFWDHDSDQSGGQVVQHAAAVPRVEKTVAVF